MYSLEEKRAEVQKIIDNVRGWLSSHGPGSKEAWPQHEIDIKTRRMDVMKEIRDDLTKAIERRSAA